MTAAHVAVAAATVVLLATPDPGAHAPDGAATPHGHLAAARLPDPRTAPRTWGPGRHTGVRGDEATSRAHPRQEPRTPAGKQAAGAPAGDLPPVLRCIRWHESRGDYRAVNAASGAAGAFQLMPQYADDWARAHGQPEWATVPVVDWPPAVQNAVALGLFREWPAAWTTYGACA